MNRLGGGEHANVLKSYLGDKFWHEYTCGHVIDHQSLDEPSRMKEPSLNATDLNKLFKEVESIDTSSGRRHLAVHQDFLLCFEPGSQTSFDNFQMYFLRRFAHIAGRFVEQHHRFAADVAETKLSQLSDRVNLANSSPKNAVFPTKKHVLKFYNWKDQHLLETLYFDDAEQLQRWRDQITLAPVFFADFEAEYRLVDRLTKEDGNVMFLAQSMRSAATVICRTQFVTSVGFQSEVETHKTKFLQEAAILIKLKGLSGVAEFKELFYTGNSFVIVEEFLDAIPFSDWFRDTWCFSLGGAKDSLPVLGLLLELIELVLHLESRGISHENISKRSFIVKVLSADCPEKKKMRSTLRIGESTIQIQKITTSQKFEFKNVSMTKFQGTSSNRKERSSLIVTTQQCEQVDFVRVPDAKVYLTGFSHAILSKAKPSDKIKTLSNFKPIHLQKDAQKSDTDWRNQIVLSDVYNLGLLLVEILYGIDIEHALQQQYAIESEFVEALLYAPSRALPGREPLYNIDSRVVEMLVWMIDPDHQKRPDIKTCFNSLLSVISQLSSPSKLLASSLIVTQNQGGAQMKPRNSGESLKMPTRGNTAEDPDPLLFNSGSPGLDQNAAFFPETQDSNNPKLLKTSVISSEKSLSIKDFALVRKPTALQSPFKLNLNKSLSLMSQKPQQQHVIKVAEPPQATTASKPHWSQSLVSGSFLSKLKNEQSQQQTKADRLLPKTPKPKISSRLRLADTQSSRAAPQGHEKRCSSAPQVCLSGRLLFRPENKPRPKFTIVGSNLMKDAAEVVREHKSQRERPFGPLRLRTREKELGSASDASREHSGLQILPNSPSFYLGTPSFRRSISQSLVDRRSPKILYCQENCV